MKRRILNLLICLDQLVLCILTLGNSYPDETASAAAWRLENAVRIQGRLFRPLIDFVFLPFESDHCRKSFEAEFNRLQSPPEERGR